MSLPLIAVSFTFGLLGQLSDCITTEKGLAHGLAESNKIMTWLTGKIGVTGVTLLKVIGLAQVAPVAAYMISQDWTAFIVVAFAVGVVGWYAGIKNYLLLKKNKISI